MTQFHKGQVVEVRRATGTGPNLYVWEKAMIDYLNCLALGAPLPRHEKWWVIFPDGTRAVVNAEHIRDASQC